MPPGKLDPSVLLALGLAAAGCGDKDTDTGPCLDYIQDTGDTGARLDDAQERTGPALAHAVARGGDRADARARVLDRGVLPTDVAGLLAREEA